MLLWKSITRCPEVRLRARGIALDEPGETMTFCPSDFRPHRLSVRTGDSQSSKRGSIPRGGTMFVIPLTQAKVFNNSSISLGVFGRDS